MTQAEPDTLHESVMQLLPWYVNGTLEAAERRSVEHHLEHCAECRDNVELLSQVRHSVRNDSPAPLVPPAHPEAMLAAIEAAENPSKVRRGWIGFGIAASVVLATAIIAWYAQDRISTNNSPTNFQTATTSSAEDSMDYVIELNFAPGISKEDREASLAALGSDDGALRMADGGYRITLGIASTSLSQLQQRMREIESRPEIESARVIAVQLPVD